MQQSVGSARCGWVAGLAVLALLAPEAARAVPSFARQTKLTCNACHTQFPELNSFGREFKLNGYTLRGIEGLEDKRSNGERDLDLPLLPLFSVMLQGSLTATQKNQNDPTLPKGDPGTHTKNETTQLPQQLSLFFAGGVSDHVGAFIQTTYEQSSGAFGIDNTDIRYANHLTIHEKPLIYGVSVNNNPTVQDLWNSTPAWGFPYAQSAVAPTPAASPLIDGALAQNVLGVTGYALWNDLLYLEAGAYRSAPQGVDGPLNGNNSSNVISGVAPYWRVALQKQYENQYFMVGAFGLLADLYPGNATSSTPLGVASPLSGSQDHYNDVGLDANYQINLGSDNITAHASWIHEIRDLNATERAGGALHVSDPLNAFKLALTYHLGTRWGFTVAPFLTTGRKDPLLYPAAPITGSRNGSPDSSGVTLEVDLNRWQNVRLALQYTAYFEFNGRSSNYDGFGRKASDNNTIYLLGWTAF